MSDIRPGQWVISVRDDTDRKPSMVMEVDKPGPGDNWETRLVFFRTPGRVIEDLASEYRLATWEEVAAAGLYVPLEVAVHDALCGVARVAADLWSCGACCDCSGCKKRNTPECDYRRLTAVFMRLEAVGVEVPEIHAEVEG